jgi:hypothetical protein
MGLGKSSVHQSSTCAALESANNTLSQIGKNISQAAPDILNKTGEVAKKIVGGAADVISNISGEIKKGVGAK